MQMEKDLKGEDPEVRRYMIQEKSSGKAIGWCSIRFHTWARRFHNADLGLCIGEKDKWGRSHGLQGSLVDESRNSLREASRNSLEVSNPDEDEGSASQSEHV